VAFGQLQGGVGAGFHCCCRGGFVVVLMVLGGYFVEVDLDSFLDPDLVSDLLVDERLSVLVIFFLWCSF